MNSRSLKRNCASRKEKRPLVLPAERDPWTRLLEGAVSVDVFDLLCCSFYFLPVQLSCL